MNELHQHPSTSLGAPDSTPTRNEEAAHLRRIVHELRSPLGTLRLSLQVAKTRIERGEAVPQATVDRALVQVDALSTLIDQIADASSLATDREEIAQTRFDPGPILRREFERQAREAPHHHWSYDYDVDATLLGDPTALERVFRALLKNAAQFSPRETTIVVSGALRGSTIEWSVTDRGIGIPPLDHPRVFELFFRASNASSQSAQGLGLGLFIAKALVLAHQGQILVESEVGRGSTFRVLLPCASPVD